MERITTSQMDFLCNFMLQHPDFAVNRIKCDNGHEKSQRLWAALAEKLNASGPPERDVKRWKKTWCDLSYKLRDRYRKLKEHSRGTGGRPPSSLFMSDLHLAVADLLRTKSVSKNFTLSKVTRPECIAFWQKLCRCLNSIGQPVQDILKWKRVPKLHTQPMPNVQRESAVTLKAAECLEIDDDEITEIKIEPFRDPLDVFDAVESLSVPNRRAQKTDNTINPPSKQRQIEKQIDPKIKSRVDSVQGQLMKKLEKNTLKRERNELLRHQNELLQKMHSSTESHRKAILAQNNELIELKRQKLAFIMGQEGEKK